MPQYDVHVLCPECAKFHDLFVRVEIDKEFEVYTVAAAYADNLLSPSVLVAVERFMCPNTLKEIPMPPPDRLVLVLCNSR